MHYTVFFINFDYAASERFHTLETAVAYAKKVCFEAAIRDHQGNTVAAFSPISGVAFFRW